MAIPRFCLRLSGPAALLLVLALVPLAPVHAESWWRQEITRYRVAPHMAALAENRAAGNWRDAVAAADRILAIEPAHTAAGLEKLRVLYENQQYDAALQAASSIPSNSPTHADARFITGLIHFETGDLATAGALLREAARDEALTDDERQRAHHLVRRLTLSQGFVALPVQYRPAYAQPPPPLPSIDMAVGMFDDSVYPVPAPPQPVPAPPQPTIGATAMDEAFTALEAGRLEDALSALARAEAEGVGAIAFLYRGYAYLRLGRETEAEAAFRKAALSPSLDAGTRSSAWAQTGYLALSRGNHAAAIDAFQQSAALAPASAGLLRQLGYAQAAALRWQDAVTTLEQAASMAGAPPQLFQDIGYAARNAGAPEKAAHWFRQALDNPGPLERERQLALKQEVEWLEDRFDMSLYSAFRGNAVDTGGLNPLERSVLQSQGGMGFRYIPKGMGRKIGRFAALTGRLLWSYEADRLAIPAASWQGGVGLSLRPLAEHNFVLGAERLIGIGRDGRDDWLFRSGYSWNHIDRDAPWPDARLYLDAAIVDPASPDILTSGDLQLGKLMEPHNWLQFWPHVTLAGNWQDDEFGSVSLLEAGPGLTTTIRFDEGRYRAWRASLSISLEYRIKLAGSSVGTSGPLLTLSLQR